jgi:hypothetical protein
MPEDPWIDSLRQLIDEARALQQQATTLVAEITDQLQRSIWMHEDGPVAEDRRRGDRRRAPRQFRRR